MSDWVGLGLQLGLSDDQLKTIKNDNPGNTKAQRREMFSVWIRTSKASYEELIKALKKEEDLKIAAELEEKIGKKKSNPKK